MQPQPQQANQATNAALQQAQAPQQEAPEAPEGMEAPEQGQMGQGDGGQDNFDSQILENLEQHLNQLDSKQKNFLASSLQHYANVVIPVLGIVCGQEVFQYFLNIYQQHFAKGAGQNPAQQSPMQVNSNSAAPAPAQGQQPNQAPPAAPMQQQAPAQQPPQQ